MTGQDTQGWAFCPMVRAFCPHTLAANFMESPTRWLHGFIFRHDFEIIGENAAQMQIVSLNWWQYAGRVWSHVNSAQTPNSHLAPILSSFFLSNIAEHHRIGIIRQCIGFAIVNLLFVSYDVETLKVINTVHLFEIWCQYVKTMEKMCLQSFLS